MSFDTRRGTRGNRQPSGRIVRLMNSLVAGRVRRKGGGKMMGLDILLLTTTGRRSGAERTVPVGWFPDGAGNWLIAASANGATDNPAWYYNLAANPDKVSIEVDGRQVAVTAAQLHGEERDKAWQTIIAASPRFTGYEEKTDRQIPVIRLVPREPANS